MSPQELENRLLALEREVAELKVRAMMSPIGNTWFEAPPGPFRDDLEWEERSHRRAEWRQAEELQYEDGN